MLVPKCWFTSIFFKAQSGSKNLNFSVHHVPLRDLLLFLSFVLVSVMIFRELRSIGTSSNNAMVCWKNGSVPGIWGAPNF